MNPVTQSVQLGDQLIHHSLLLPGTDSRVRTDVHHPVGQQDDVGARGGALRALGSIVGRAFQRRPDMGIEGNRVDLTDALQRSGLPAIINLPVRNQGVDLLPKGPHPRPSARG